MKNFDSYKIKFEHRRHGQEAKYKCKMKTHFWKYVSDFIKSRMWHRRFDAIITKKFGDNGSNIQGYDTFNKRMVFATIIG